MVVIYILGVIGAVILVVCAVSVIWRAFIVFQMLKVTIHNPNTNDDDIAVKRFMDLLDRAHENMAVYDDGNKMKRSVYMQQPFVDAVKKKLADEPNFTMRCYFNFKEDTLFSETFHNEPRVSIRTGEYTPETRPNDTHYKIIDDGRMAYLSRHKHDSSDRQFQIIDCTQVGKSAFKSVTNKLLGEYMTDIEEKFASV